jgi:hypothetical protein
MFWMKFSLLVRGFLLIATLCGLLFFIVVKFSIIESRYECVGKIKNEDQDQQWPTTLFIKIQEYRGWVGLWNDRNIGRMFVEEPTQPYELFLITDKFEDQLRIKDMQGNTIGGFSTLSKTLELKWHGGDFTGRATLMSK